MSKTIIWHSGQSKYKKHTYTIDPTAKKHEYTLELLDTPSLDNRNIYQIFNDHLTQRQTKYVEVLYSGGVDSELVLHTCLVNKIPTKAVTMKLVAKGITLNTHDLYYSTEYCRKNNIDHLIIELDLIKFFNQGMHFSYLDPYYIVEPHVATHFWLFEQCNGFPVLGGEYGWPWPGSNRLLSPIRSSYSQYDRFLQDKNIHGIGSMLDYSLESNLHIIKNQLYIYSLPDTVEAGQGAKIAQFKNTLYKRLGFSTIEPRLRSYGWESTADITLFNKFEHTINLTSKYGITRDSIVWNEMVGNVLGTLIRRNDKFK